MRRTGISTLEIIALIAFTGLIGLIVWWQFRLVEARDRDLFRKTSINAIYYSLKEIYYSSHKSYPQVLHVSDLKGIDPTRLKDPEGRLITDPASDYRYEPRDCDGQTCAGFTLRSSLEQEADFIKSTAQS